MARTIKMCVYGEPGVGKSTFAAKAPKPFFITTDGNYEYLVDFCGLDEKDHIQVTTWKEMKYAFSHTDFSKYETIVVDLVEDAYMWAENEFCKDSGLTHISDLGYGKGYGILANDFFIEFQKLLAQPKNIILIFHGVTEVLKDRRGVEYTKYGPSKLIREKIVTQIEGRVRFFVRAFAETSEDGKGNLITQRYLSLSPDGTTEYGITRGLSGEVPRNIPLDWDIFYEIAMRNPVGNGEVRRTVEEATVEVKKPKTTTSKTVKTTPVEEKPAPVEEKKPVVEEDVKMDEETATDTVDDIRAKLKAMYAAKQEAPVEETSKQEAPATEKTNAETQLDKLAAIRAKMAALKAKEN